MPSEHPVTRHQRGGYPLRRLIGLPVGLFVVVVIVTWLIWPALRENLGGLEAIVALPLLFLGQFALIRYYRVRGGLPPAAVTPGGPWLFIIGLFVLGWGLRILVSPEAGIAAQGVWASLAILVTGCHFRTHRLAGAALICLSLALPYALSTAASLSTIWNLVWLALGCAIVVVSIYEHLTFTRTGATRYSGEDENAAPA